MQFHNQQQRRAQIATNHDVSTFVDRGTSLYNVKYNTRLTRVNFVSLNTGGRTFWNYAPACFFEMWVTPDAFNTGDRNNCFAIFGTNGWPRLKVQLYSTWAFIYGSSLSSTQAGGIAITVTGGFTTGQIYYLAGGINYATGVREFVVGNPATGQLDAANDTHTYQHTSMQPTLQFRVSSWSSGHGYGGSTNDYGLTGTLHNCHAYRTYVPQADFISQFNARQMNPVPGYDDDRQTSEGFAGAPGTSITLNSQTAIFNNGQQGQFTTGSAQIAEPVSGDSLL